MTRLGIEEKIVDEAARERTIARFRQAGIVLPTFAEIADPLQSSPSPRAALAGIDPDSPTTPTAT